jgi:hypothetical protein
VSPAYFQAKYEIPVHRTQRTSTYNCSVYVAYPKIAQSAVNDSTLKIKSMIITEPTPESFHLDQQQILGTDSSYHPKIYEFDAEVSLGGAPVPFATVTVPEVKSKDGAEIHVVQKVDLTDVDAFGDYTTAVMLSEELELNIKGKPDLKQGGLPKTHVTYDQTVKMKGMFFPTLFHVDIGEGIKKEN